MTNNLPYVVSDLDGTLISSGYEIKPETIKDVLEYQKASGNKFSFATGRSDYMCKPIIAKLDVKNPIISCNGAMIRDPKTNKVLYTEYLDKEIATNCFKQAANLGLDIVGYDEEAIIVTKDSNRYKVWSEINKSLKARDWEVPFKIYPDMNSMIKDIESGKLKLLKMLIDCNIAKKDREAVSVFKKYENELDFTWSGNNLLDAMKKDVSKGTALKHLADILKIDVKDIVCFGDNFNDIPMLSQVKRSYAVDNAVQPLKDIAYQVCDSLENNGVGKILIDMINHKN